VLDLPIETEGLGGKDAERTLMDKVHQAIEKNFVEPA